MRRSEQRVTIRPPRGSRLWLLMGAAAAALGGAGVALPMGGCQSARDASSSTEEGGDSLAIRPEWQQFVDDNYRGVIMAELNRTYNVRFPSAPTVAATRSAPRGRTVLLAVGEVDEPLASGEKLRRPFVIRWSQSGREWTLQDVRLERGRPAPPDPIAPLKAAKPPTAPTP